MNVVRKEAWVKLVRALLKEIEVLEEEAIILSRLCSKFKGVADEASPGLAHEVEQDLSKLKTYADAIVEYRKLIVESMGRIDKSAID